MKITELSKMAQTSASSTPAACARQELIFAILKVASDRGGEITAEGVLEILSDGFGFLRSPDYSYLPGPDDIYVSPVADPPLRPADRRHRHRPHPPAARGRALLRAAEGRDRSTSRTRRGDASERILFDNLTPLYPTRKLKLEHDGQEMTTRIIDLFSPIGKGQRCLIVAPPRAGKTVLLQNIAHAIASNHPEVVPHRAAHRRAPRGSHRHASAPCAARSSRSTFDEPATRHVQVAEMVIEKAKRLVEHKQRRRSSCSTPSPAWRAPTTRSCPPSGKILSGGVDANALHKPKRFFGAARNIEEGGSLTIIGTALDRHRQPHGRGHLRGVQGHR